MKKILLLCIIVFTANISLAQKGSRERVKALKIAYITEQLNLNSKEAQQFWPIYNEHQDTMEGLKKKERKSIRAIKEAEGFDSLSENEAEDFLSNYLQAEERKFIARKKLITDLRQVIPHKKILKLVKAEMDFNKRLLKQLRNRRQRN
ncbi:sensor of ECF-type sigma factor [Aquimarina sp. 2201CG14-23]|uniref:sensor of ECF-type sigma factor n=1 Tax=Aquimarina mycalae TaxID=3040073 RepID=UPI002477CFC6|nr:sensor of ECF-type sigma factor [Aquimarina sp. 2201CG14-23]MDH7447206.1 sensor of ECF-type sigma factor [Aquimarina sp. 2201CG14-23]